MARAELVNDFTLSYSLASLIQRCARAWYWKAYGSWKGWEDAAPPEARLAYAINKGQSLDALVGSLVHRVALEAVLAASAAMPEPDAASTGAWALGRLREAVLTAPLERWKLEPKRSPMLMDYFYGAPDLDDRLRAAEEKLARALAALRSNQRLQRVCDGLRAGTARVVSAEEPQRFTVDVGPDIVDVWVVIDMAIEHVPTGKVVVLDWKTGKVHDIEEAQLGLYALWLRDVRGVHPSGVSLVRAYLVTREERTKVATEEDFERARAHLREARAIAAGLVIDGDLAHNVPKPRDAFEQLAKGSRECAWCDYRIMCGR